MFQIARHVGVLAVEGAAANHLIQLQVALAALLLFGHPALLELFLFAPFGPRRAFHARSRSEVGFLAARAAPGLFCCSGPLTALVFFLPAPGLRRRPAERGLSSTSPAFFRAS